MIQANRAHVKEGGGRRKWLKLSVLLAGVYLIWVLVGGILDIRQANRRVDEARLRLAEAQVKNEELERKMAEVQTREYLERVARNELLMQKEGETVVVLSQLQQTPVQGGDEPREEKETPNYQKWWNLVR